MRKKLFPILFSLMGSVCLAQVSDDVWPQYSVATNSFWSNWCVQLGVDMSLQNPYGYNFANVFPNGKSFGLDFGMGKRVTPGFGLRGKMNWENGLKLFKNDQANWLAPFHEPGVNLDKGGYLAFVGDIQFSLPNLFNGYDEERVWDMMVYPRAGVVYNFGVSKGSPLVGVGLGGSYRLDDRWSLYADMAYQMTSSGFVGVVKNTGTGSNSNGYFDINVGVQLNLDDSRFKKVGPQTRRIGDGSLYEHSVATHSFWSDWFVQAGLDMSLQNPYGCNFSQVFPKGKTFGVDVAAGKWFAPEVGLRVKLNWENGLFKNDHLEWVAPAGRNGINHDEGGYMLISGDVMFNVQNIFWGYDEERRWHLSVYPRAGLIRNFAIDSASPVVGVGIDNTYRLNDRLSIYADIDYQVTTSESSAGLTGMSVSTGSNGFFDLSVGIQIDLGNNKFRKL